MAKVPFSCDNTSALNYLLLTFPVVTESFFGPVNYAFVRNKIIQPGKFTDKIKMIFLCLNYRPNIKHTIVCLLSPISIQFNLFAINKKYNINTL